MMEANGEVDRAWLETLFGVGGDCCRRHLEEDGRTDVGEADRRRLEATVPFQYALSTTVTRPRICGKMSSG